MKKEKLTAEETIKLIHCKQVHEIHEKGDMDKLKERLELIEVYGWVCPKCDTALSPYTNTCPCSYEYGACCAFTPDGKGSSATICTICGEEQWKH